MSCTEIGSEIRLKGKSRKGKNRIKEQGEWWVITDVLWKDPQFPTNSKPPFLHVDPVEGTVWGPRWIAVNDDPDFEIVEGAE